MTDIISLAALHVCVCPLPTCCELLHLCCARQVLQAAQVGQTLQDATQHSTTRRHSYIYKNSTTCNHCSSNILLFWSRCQVKPPSRCPSKRLDVLGGMVSKGKLEGQIFHGTACIRVEYSLHYECAWSTLAFLQVEASRAVMIIRCVGPHAPHPSSNSAGLPMSSPSSPPDPQRAGCLDGQGETWQTAGTATTAVKCNTQSANLKATPVTQPRCV